jgi:hypothetical protein
MAKFLLSRCMPLALLGLMAASASAQQYSSSARFVVAEYMRAAPSEPTRACKRVCVKSKSEGNKAAPMCLQWKTVC